MCFMFSLLITTLINASKYIIRSSKCGTMHVSDATFIHIMQDYRGPGFVHIHGGGSTGGSLRLRLYALYGYCWDVYRKPKFGG